MTYFSRLSWYARRLGRMSPGEVAWRVHEHRFLQGDPRVGLGKLIVLHGSERSFLQFGERS